MIKLGRGAHLHLNYEKYARAVRLALAGRARKEMSIRLAFSSLCQEYEKTREKGGSPYGADHAAACIRALGRLGKEATAAGELKEKQLAVVELALCYAWARKTRRASALWAEQRVVGDLTDGHDHEIGEKIHRLILVARGEELANSPAEELIAQVAIAVSEAEQAAAHAGQ